MKRILLAAAALLAVTAAQAADLPAPMPTKAPPAASYFGYPAASGFYFGVNGALAAGQANTSSTVAAANAGALISTQAEVGGTVGYAWAARGTPFWGAVEATFDYVNLNAQTTGFSFGSGTADLSQLAIVGAPWGFISSVIPQFVNLQFPALPTLPSGVTAGPVNMYVGGGVYEQDVSPNFMLTPFHAWLVGGEAVVGVRSLLSNSTALDVRFEYRSTTQQVCITPGGAQGCAGLGNSYMVRTSVLW